MFTKQSLKKEFSSKWKEQYQVSIFEERGFIRKRCPKCGKHFWTTDTERELCGDPPCENYSFIGNTVTRKKWDYVTTWKEFESFFKKHGHTSVPRYPVVDRWRPDLFFTIASIQDFQRIDKGNTVMEYPSDPLIVPQVCLRFPDITNVGITGRHHTSFIMAGQHSFGNYWKDRCIELNFKFLHDVMGIPENELTYVEDLWAMPDFSQFGPCLETFSRGLELVNSVFSQYTARGSSYVELPQKVIDVGWGHERLVWFSNGTHAGYDSVFGPVIKWMKSKSGLKENDLFDRYSALAGSLDFGEVKNINKVRNEIADKLGVSVGHLNEVIGPMQALYAIADHTKTLLFAITDGAIPSNVGGGYNLRVILRRALSFIRDHEFDFTLDKIAELHASHMRPLFPELKNGLGTLSKVIDIEKERYEKTTEKAMNLVKQELRKGLTKESMVTLYSSHGITPELVEKVARKEGHEVSVPDVYSEITSHHMVKDKDDEHVKMNLTGIPATKMMYYEDPYGKAFNAKVIKKKGDWAILDRTFFYAEGGGQPGDRGIMKASGREYNVEDVQKIGDIIIHKVSGLREGQTVHGEIDWDRRMELMRMHSGTHLIAGSARKVLGPHIWQAGAQKGLDVSRLDLTHYKPFSQQELEKIEKTANDAIKNNIPVKAEFMDRTEAEGKYGFVLYQGGASPGKRVRVVDVEGFDVEACGGTHVTNTGEIELIKIVRSERIQDGVNRLVYACGSAAKEYVRKQEKIHSSALKIMKSISKVTERHASVISRPANVTLEVQAASDALSVSPDSFLQTLERFAGEIISVHEEINSLRKTIGHKSMLIEEEPFVKEFAKRRVRNMSELSMIVFDLWKRMGKERDKYLSGAASQRAEKLLSREKDGSIFDVIPGERKELIKTASEIIKMKPKVTVILANPAGDIVIMSRTHDANHIMKGLEEKSGAHGGGSKEFAQGRADVSKLIKIMQKD